MKILLLFTKFMTIVSDRVSDRIIFYAGKDLSEMNIFQPERKLRSPVILKGSRRQNYCLKFSPFVSHGSCIPLGVEIISRNRI